MAKHSKSTVEYFTMRAILTIAACLLLSGAAFQKTHGEEKDMSALLDATRRAETLATNWLDESGHKPDDRELVDKISDTLMDLDTAAGAGMADADKDRVNLIIGRLAALNILAKRDRIFDNITTALDSVTFEYDKEKGLTQ